MARGKMTEITILKMLSIRPMYGVEMIEEIKRLSGNAVVMSLPTLYSSLHRMAEKKFVNSYQREAAIGGRCRVYNIAKSGREYLAKNPIEINYQQLADDFAVSHKTYATLEEAFSLPLNKKPTTAPALPEEKRVLQITPPPEPVTPPPAPKPAPKPKTTPGISPYIAPTEKITATPEPQYQQTSIGLSGTLGGNELRPLLKLNSIAVGNDYVIINRLHIFAAVLTTALFLLINFLCSLSHAVSQEYYGLVYIALIVYLLIWLAIYLVYPRIKSAFNRKASGIHHLIASLIILALVLVYSIIAGTASLLWIMIFALLPLTEFVFLIMFRKRSWFIC